MRTNCCQYQNCFPLLALLVSSLQCTWLIEVYNSNIFLEDIALQDTSSQPRWRRVPNRATPGKPLGVFVLKVQHAHEALLSLCVLNTFFNHGPQYPIRIFADEEPASNTTIPDLQGINPLVDLQVVVDKEQRWKRLPPELSESERAEIQASCTVQSCTTRMNQIGYVYMGYWRYRVMAYEPSLKGFDYFISWDTDAYLTQPLQVDPFRILQQNNLTGFYVTDNSNYAFDQGIEESSSSVFGNSTQDRGYLNSPNSFPLYNRFGVTNHRSFYGYLFGGRLDFFRSPDFREFGRLMVPFTYRYRVDEQIVIAKAWSMMVPDLVWHFPSRGYRLGVFHNSDMDDQKLINCNKPPPSGAIVYNHTNLGVCYWVNPMLTGNPPMRYEYPGDFWFDEVDYFKYVQSLSALRNDEHSTAMLGFATCRCLPTQAFMGNKMLCPDPRSSRRSG